MREQKEDNREDWESWYVSSSGPSLDSWLDNGPTLESRGWGGLGKDREGG